MATRELGQPVEVVARSALLATGEVALTDGAGEAGVALRITGEGDQVGPGRIRSPGARRRRHATDARGARIARDVGATAGQGELDTEDGRYSHFFCRLGKAHHPVEPVVVGQRQRPELEAGSLRDELLGVGGTVEETEIRMAVELCVPDHEIQDSGLSNVCSQRRLQAGLSANSQLYRPQ